MDLIGPLNYTMKLHEIRHLSFEPFTYYLRRHVRVLFQYTTHESLTPGIEDKSDILRFIWSC
jgi:hypothetical protein